MRRIIALAATLFLTVELAHAGEAEGKVTAIDPEKMTITLTDKVTYKLPGEFDLSALEKGMSVVLAFDEVNGEKLITDMDIQE